MKKLILLMAGIAALYHFKPEVFPSTITGFGNGAFDSNGNAQVVIFTFKGCGAPCRDALGLLRAKGVSFENVDVSRSRENEQRLRSMGGGSSLPVTFVGKQRVEGFHRQRLSEALSQAYGLDMLDGATREVISTHFNADGSAKVVMYGTSWCPYCKKAREFFRAKGIAYTELDVEKDFTAKRRYGVIRSAGYPLIYVGANRFEGLDKTGILTALKGA